MFQLAKTHPRYPKYKPTNIDWIGDIPDGWEAMKLRFIWQFSSSGIDKKLDDNEPTVRMVNYTDVYGNKERKLTASREYMITTTSEEKKLAHQVSVWDLIFTPSSETIEDIWVSALIEEELPETVFSYHVSRFSFSQPIFHAFKKYLCNNTATYAQFSSKATWTTRKTLAREDFNSTLVVIPGTLEEQWEIAVYLDEKTALIDEAIAKKKQQIELLSEHRTALINNAITKGLDPNAEMKDSGIDWIGMIPRGWEIKKIKHLWRTFNGATPKSDIRDYWDWDIVWATPEDLSQLKDKYISESKRMITENWYQSCGTTIVPKDSVILSCRAPIGLLAISKVPLCSNQGCKSIVPNSHSLATFLYFSLLANKWSLDAISSWTTFKELSSKRLADFFIAIPSIEEQEEIVAYLEKETIYIDAMKEKIQRSIDLLQEYKTSLISHVVSGKIKVS